MAWLGYASFFCHLSASDRLEAPLHSTVHTVSREKGLIRHFRSIFWYKPWRNVAFKSSDSEGMDCERLSLDSEINGGRAYPPLLFSTSASARSKSERNGGNGPMSPTIIGRCLAGAQGGVRSRPTRGESNSNNNNNNNNNGGGGRNGDRRKRKQERGARIGVRRNKYRQINKNEEQRPRRATDK